MVRLFGVYHASRTVALLGGEILLILVFSLAVPPLYLSVRWPSLPARPSVWLAAGLMILVWCLCLYFYDLYQLDTRRGWRQWGSNLLRAAATVYIVLMLLGGVVSPFWGSPGILGVATLLLTGLLFSERLLVSLPPLRPAPRRCLLIGLSDLGLELAGEIRRRPELGIQLIGYLGENGPAPLPPDSLPYLGSLDNLASCLGRNRVELAVIALRERRRFCPVEDLLPLRFTGLKVLEAPTLYERITGKIPVEELYPSWLLFSEGFRLESRALKGQRALSLLLSIVGMLAAWPLLLVIAGAIKLESPGPILFRQERVARFGRRFLLYKFRSMREDAERATGPVWAREQDNRVTRVGRVLRQLRLDELPQLWNVVRGDMNLVGPRPERPVFVEQLTKQVPYYNYRHVVRPGISGWAQVNYRYGATVEDQREKLRYDLFYIKNFSLWLDLYILFLTVKVVLRGRGAR